MEKWCHQWRITVNTDKSKIMHFRHRSQKGTQTKFQLFGELELVSKYKYLGVTLNQNADAVFISEELAEAASCGLGSIVGKMKSNYDLSYATFTKLYMTCVDPILNYACGAWNTGGNHSKADGIQHRAIRFHAGLPKNTPVLGLVGDMGWTPSVVKRDVEVIRMYNQIVTLPHTRIARKVFEYDCSCNGEWSSNVRHLLTSLGKAHCWDHRNPISVKEAQTSLCKMYEEVWCMEVEEKPKLRTYKHIKQSIRVEPHLKVNMCKWKRALISRIRCGVLMLEVEAGRYKGIESAQRICKLCSKEPETELHFLFNCESYDKARNKLYYNFPELASCADNCEKFQKLCTMPYTFSNFIAEIWNLRTAKIQTLPSS